MRLFNDIFDQLNAKEVKYVLVGGLAVVLHGHLRATGDVDLVIGLDEENARKAIDTLTGMGMRPRVPVQPHEFLDPNVRKQWAEQRNMLVFSLSSPSNPFYSVDLFLEPPLPFDELFKRSIIVQLDATPVRVCSVKDLIHLKRTTGRAQDLEDIEALEELDQ